MTILRRWGVPWVADQLYGESGNHPFSYGVGRALEKPHWEWEDCIRRVLHGIGCA